MIANDIIRTMNHFSARVNAWRDILRQRMDYPVGAAQTWLAEGDADFEGRWGR
jgi:hypothetical protein